MRALGVLAAGVCVGLGLAACSSDNGGAIDVPASSTTSTLATTSTSDAGGDVLQGAGTTPVSIAPRNPTALLTSVRVAHQPGFDRVVFEFESSTPGYRVAYTSRPVTEDASGKEITVQGKDVLAVRMEAAATADLASGTVRRTYTGPDRVAASDTTAVTELVKAGDFEAVLTWVIGVRDKTGFKVSTLQNPSRLVVDLRAR